MVDRPGFHERDHRPMSQAALAFDVTSTITGATGIARYVRATAEALGHLEGAPEVRPFAVGRGTLPPPAGTAWLRAPLRVVGASWRWGGPPRVERLVGSVASVHASGIVLPRADAPIVAVVHDLAPLDHPHLHHRRTVRLLRRYVADLRRAAAVIAVSETTAARLRPLVPDGVVHVTPNGCTTLPAPDPPPSLPTPYVLAVGAPVPRKGYEQLVRAIARPELADVSLVIVGPAGDEDPALAALARELGVEARYLRPGEVSEARLAGWYEGAAVVGAPSVDEGFGLPVVEAQRMGVPVVASDIAAHREVGGGAVSLVPTGAVEPWVEALAVAIRRGAPVEQMVAAGRRNAQRYTWEACAAATLAVHRLVAAG
jgi:glycosyltransferase involved in cell wall biosynthesis